MRTFPCFPSLFGARCQRTLATSAAVLVAAVSAPSVFGGSLLYTGGIVTENFDNLGIAGLTTTLLTGAGSLPNDGTSPWFTGVVASGTGNTAAFLNATDLNSVSDGSVAVVNSTVRLFNNGQAGTNALSDRALGTGDTGGDPVIDLLIKNSSGSAMSGFSLSFDTEWWRGGVGTAANFGYLLYYSPTGDASTWTQITATQPSKTFATAEDLDGNAAANRQNISANFTLPAQLANGGTFFLRWRDDNDATNSPDANIAIDNFSFTGVLTVPIKNLVYNRAHTVGGAPNGVLSVSAATYWLNGAAAAGFSAGDNITLSQDGAAAISVPADAAPGSTTVSNASGAYTISGAGKISGPLTKSNAGTLVLAGANAFSTVTLNGGTIVTQAAGALGTTAPLTVSSSGTIQTDADVAVVGINGTAPLIKTGTGALGVTGTGTGSGGIRIQGGKLQADSDAALGGNTQGIILDGGTLEFTNSAADVTFSDATKTRVINVASGGGTISGTVGLTGTTSIGLVIGLADSLTGSGGLTKNGPSALRIAANQSTLTSNWNINAGTLEYGVGLSNALGSGTVTINANGHLAGRGNTAPATTVIPNNVILNGGDLTTRSSDTTVFGGGVNVASNSTATLRSYSTPTNSQGMAISGILSGSADLTLAGLNPQTNGGNKALSLTRAGNSFSGTFRVSAGQILASEPAAGVGSALGTGAIVLSNSTLRIRDNGAGSGGLLAYGNNLAIDTGVSTLDLDHAAGGTSTGNTIQFNTLSIGNQTLIVTGANSYQASFIGASTLTGDATIDTNTKVIVSGAVSGAFGFTKVGAGLLTLNALNTFSGAATVSGGSLGGTGSVAGVLTVNGATLAPGDGTGTFSAGGNLTLAASSTLSLDLAHGAGATPVPGTDYDRLMIGTGTGVASTGTVTLGSGALTLTLGAGIKLNDTYFIVLNDGVDPVAGTFNGLADDSTFTSGTYRFQISYDANSATGLLSGGNDIALVTVQVPEPAISLLAFCGAAGLLGLRRRPKAS